MNETILPEDLRPQEPIRRIQKFADSGKVVAFEILPDGRVNVGLYETQEEALKRIAVADDPMEMFHCYDDLGPKRRLFSPKDVFCQLWYQEQAVKAGFPEEFWPADPKMSAPGAPNISEYLMMICVPDQQELLYLTMMGMAGAERGNIA